MKFRSFLLIILTVACFIQPVYAAFPVKHITVTNSPVKNPDENTAAAGVKSQKKITNILRRDSWLHPVRRKNDTVGLLSMIFGIVGVVPFYGILFAIAATILGANGRKRDERFSLPGLILGIIGLGIDVLIVALAIIIAFSYV